MTATAIETPIEIDSALAAIYMREQDTIIQLGRHLQSALGAAGATFYYQRKQRVTDMTFAEAEAILAADVAAHAATADPSSPDYDYGYRLIRGGRNIGAIRTTVAGIAECRAAIAEARAEMDVLEQSYTGWSRFFLVTSSKGHIHSSRHCSTCRPTTTYGWLPALSGRTEADCVAEFGPALCSVCFPSAPVEWTTGEVTKAAATKAAAA